MVVPKVRQKVKVGSLLDTRSIYKAIFHLFRDKGSPGTSQQNSVPRYIFLPEFPFRARKLKQIMTLYSQLKKS
jgi:hypothetical protein